MTLSWLSGLKKCPDDAVMTLRVEKVSGWRCHDSQGWKSVRMTLSWLFGLKKGPDDAVMTLRVEKVSGMAFFPAVFWVLSGRQVFGQ